jgi:hypothetical protein
MSGGCLLHLQPENLPFCGDKGLTYGKSVLQKTKVFDPKEVVSVTESQLENVMARRK